MKPTTVLICIPSGKVVDAELLVQAVDLMAHPDGALKRLCNPRICYVTTARNMGVHDAQQLDADYLLFIDADMEFPPDTLQRLLAHQKAIVGATYCKRSVPHTILGEVLGGGDIRERTGLVEMATLPAGCLLIRTSVFSRLTKPYFRLPFDETSGLEESDDFTFCRRARTVGLGIWCDADLSKDVGHIGNKSFKITQDGEP